MNILLFDCSTDRLYAGLARGDGVLFSQDREGSRHAELLLPALEHILSQASVSMADIDLIACTQGPGSFTGLRIGIATAKGLSLAIGKPWVPLPTLDCLAKSLSGDLAPYTDPCPQRSSTVVPVLDARKKRLYAAVYRSGHRDTEYLDISIEELLRQVDADEEVSFLGQAAELFTDYSLERPGFRVEALSAPRLLAAMALLAQERLAATGPATEDEAPLYLREPEIG